MQETINWHLQQIEINQFDQNVPLLRNVNFNEKQEHILTL